MEQITLPPILLWAALYILLESPLSSTGELELGHFSHGDASRCLGDMNSEAKIMRIGSLSTTRCPGRRKASGSNWRWHGHGSDVDVQWNHAILYVDLLQNFNHLFDQKASSCPPLPHVLVVYFVAHPNNHFQLVQTFKVLYNNQG